MSTRRRTSIVETILADSQESRVDASPHTSNGSKASVPTEEHAVEGESRDFLSLLRRRKWIIAALTVLTAATAFALTSRQTKIYSSSATVLLEVPPWQAPSSSLNMATEKQVGASAAVATLAAQTLNISTAPQDLVKNLSIDVPVDTEILRFTYSDATPAVAKQRADAFANAYLSFRRDQLQTELVTASRSIESRIQFLTDQLSAIQRGAHPATSTSQAQATSLITQIGILQQRLANISPDQNVFPGGVLSAAVLPRSPSKPKPALNIGLGVFAGLLLGLGVAALLEYSDDRIRGPKEIQSRLSTPVLSTVPVVRRRKPWASPSARLVTLRDPASWGAEAFRQLRTNFLFASRQERARSILITSPEPEEGKTYVTGNLGVALAKAGKRVVLISADLRRPALEAMFKLKAGPGLVDLLLDTVGLADVVQETGVTNLRIIQGGSQPSNPTELLGSDRTMRLISQIADDVDYVLVDASPVLPVADAAALAPACDAVLLVADARKTTRASVAKASEQLHRIGALTLGSVLLDPGVGRAGARATYRSSARHRHQVVPMPDQSGRSNGAGVRRGSDGEEARS